MNSLLFALPFELLAERREVARLRLSTVASVSGAEVFGDSVVAGAILDRLLHHSHLITIRGDSYRLKDKKRSGLYTPPAEADEGKETSS